MSFNTYNFKYKRGIDDLRNVYAWHGNSQGDESATNDIEEAKSRGSWMSYMFGDIDPTDQNAINLESERRRKENDAYIAKLKLEGRFGEEYTVTMHVKHNPIFDTPPFNKKVYIGPSPPPSNPLESYKMVFIDLNKS